MYPGRVEKHAGDDPGFELVHADVLRFFPALVAELGGDPGRLTRAAGLPPPAPAKSGPSLSFRAVAALLEHAAAELQQPDLGMRLAMRQGGPTAFGPIGVVMRNSSTLGEALGYVVEHGQAYSLAAQITVERERGDGQDRVLAALKVLLDRPPPMRQAVEQAMLLGQLNATQSTGGAARVREVLFRHQPLSPQRVYRERFGCEVRFDQEVDAIVFSERDMACPIVNPDGMLYEMATSFIENRFSRASPPMHASVRGLVLQHLGSGECTNERVAAELGLHPRTLHRRLKIEGRSFESIKDEVRRDVALSCLREGELPLSRIAERLGYAESSVLSRSCFRWFGASPSQLRADARRDLPGRRRAVG